MRLHGISESFVAAVAALYKNRTVQLSLGQASICYLPYNHRVIQEDSIPAFLYIVFCNI